MMDWSDQKRQEQEQEKPIPPYTKVTAIRDFKGRLFFTLRLRKVQETFYEKDPLLNH